jgi:CRISPR-associated protein Cas1
MATLYIDEPGAHLSKRGECLLVQKDDRLLAEVELVQVDRVVISGHAGLTSAALTALLFQGIDCILLDFRGQYLGRLVGRESPHVALRRAQYALVAEPERALALARTFVAAKLANCRVLLLRNGDRSVPAVTEAVAALEQAVERARTAADAASLLGVEGAATRAYFGALPIPDRDSWGFSQRARRPPPDPVNAALSLAYTLLCSEAISAVAIAGFDPHCGFYHADAYGRPSLALDLMEQFRPVIADSVVITLFGRGMVSRDDFAPDNGGVYLTERLRERFYRLFEERMLTRVAAGPSGEHLSYRQVLRRHAQALARAVLDPSAPYQPFTWR